MTDSNNSEQPRQWPDEPLADALPDQDEESTGTMRITEVKSVDPRLNPRDRATLTILSGPDTGRVFSLEGEPVLGRGHACQVRIDDNSVSRSHARVSALGPMRWGIADLGSRNGTFINGTRVHEHELRDGDLIQLGASVRFRFAVANLEEENVLRKLYESSVRDGLTGAYNRKHFNERLATEISYAVRHSADLALVMYDIDHFKRVNDVYGHLAGDRVLAELTGVIHYTVRAEDFLARYGGEEFAVIARGIGKTGAIRLGERIRGVAERISVSFEGVTLRVTVSVGVAVFSDLGDRQDSEALIGRADACMYKAKQGGRNMVVSSP